MGKQKETMGKPKETIGKLKEAIGQHKGNQSAETQRNHSKVERCWGQTARNPRNTKGNHMETGRIVGKPNEITRKSNEIIRALKETKDGKYLVTVADATIMEEIARGNGRREPGLIREVNEFLAKLAWTQRINKLYYAHDVHARNSDAKTKWHHPPDAQRHYSSKVFNDTGHADTVTVTNMIGAVDFGRHQIRISMKDKKLLIRDCQSEKRKPMLVRALHQTLIQDRRIDEISGMMICPEEVHEIYWDDVLDQKLVKKARAEEMEEFKKHNVYTKVPIEEAWEAMKKAPIGVRWMDVNKGDKVHPETRK